MQLFRLKKGAPNDQIIVDGAVPEGFYDAIKNFGYEPAGGIEAILEALSPDRTSQPEAPKRKRSLLGL